MKLHRAFALSFAFSAVPLAVACDDADAPPGDDVAEDTSGETDLLPGGDTGPDVAMDVESPHDGDTVPADDTAEDVTGEDGHTGDVTHTTPHWTYEGEGGPEFWGRAV